uniref:K Homology domain-containing protein n=1 Tax=Lactuca sativa TaxID=4236 RepID=A0A9R1UCN9_LACSA|nr:hypothetical protein LSAT_V11C900460000 [Lactuca sativa]
MDRKASTMYYRIQAGSPLSGSLVLLGDEVYQDERPFISSRKVLFDMGEAISKELELISFHTVSKAFLGECGQRGGYFEMTNIPPQDDQNVEGLKIATGHVAANTIRLLIYGCQAGGLIGVSGQNIGQLRKSFGVNSSRI